MSNPIPIRSVELTLSDKTPRYWYGGDPFKTHFMNALSSTFPEGEAFFVRLFYLLAKDGLAWKPRVWIDGARFLWGRDGVLRALIPDYLEWYRSGFHPRERDDQPLIDAGLARLPEVRASRA